MTRDSIYYCHVCGKELSQTDETFYNDIDIGVKLGLKKPFYTYNLWVFYYSVNKNKAYQVPKKVCNLCYHHLKKLKE